MLDLFRKCNHKTVEIRYTGYSSKEICHKCEHVRRVSDRFHCDDPTDFCVVCGTLNPYEKHIGRYKQLVENENHVDTIVCSEWETLHIICPNV